VARAACAAPLGLAVALIPATSAAAEGADAAPYGTPSTRCEITDPRLPEISGLASAGDTMLAMNDGGDPAEDYVLDGACAVGDVRSGHVDTYPPENIALAGEVTV